MLRYIGSPHCTDGETEAWSCPLPGRPASEASDARGTSEHFPPFCLVAAQSPAVLQGSLPWEPLCSLSLPLILATLQAVTCHPHYQGCQF